MSTRIGYNSATTAFGQMLAEFVDEYKALQAKGLRLHAALESMAQGATWSAIETELGADAGSGETIYNLVTGAKVVLATDAALIALTPLDQG